VTTAWLSPAQCADEIGVTRQHIHDLIAQGKIKAKRFSEKVTRIPRVEWDRYLSSAPDAPTDVVPAA
jgi:excisionase family DNA binding protein